MRMIPALWAAPSTRERMLVTMTTTGESNQGRNAFLPEP